MNIHDVSQGPVPRPQYVRTVQRYVQCRVDHHKRGAVLGTVQGHYVPNGVCFDQSRSIDWYLQYRKGHMRAFERIGVLKLSILDERSVIRGPSCPNVNADIPCWCRDWHDRIVRLFCALAPAGPKFCLQHCHHSDRAGQDSTTGSTHTNIYPPDASANHSAGRNQGTLQGDYGYWSSGHRLWFLLLRSESTELSLRIHTSISIPYSQYETTRRYFSQPIYPHSNSDLIQSFESDLHTVPWPALLLAGGVAGVAGWITTFPFDLVKTRVQTTPASQAKRGFFQGGGVTISMIVQSWRNEGLRVFGRGLAPTLIRHELVSTANGQRN